MHGFNRPIEAALALARAFGVELSEVDPVARQKAQERREKEDLYIRQARACHRALENHPRVGEWWGGRGFGKELQKRFLLGATEDGTAAVIPFWHRGRVQGLIRRKLEGKPKYLNPTSEEFAGGYRPLFIPGPLRAGAFLVEGIVDALAVAALEESAIAVSGTGISPRQMEELDRLPGPLYIFPDDEKGAEAAREWTRELYPKAFLCPAGYAEEAAGAKDVADVFAAEGPETKKRLDELKVRAADALQLELSAEALKGSNSLEVYRAAKEQILPLLLKLEDQGEQDAALHDVTDKLKLSIKPLRNALAALRTQAMRTEGGEPEAAEAPPQPHTFRSTGT
jgi:DNA primase